MPLPVWSLGWEMPESRTVPRGVHLWQWCARGQKRAVGWVKDMEKFTEHQFLGGLSRWMSKLRPLFLLDVPSRWKTVRVKKKQHPGRNRILSRSQLLLGSHRRSRRTRFGPKGCNMVRGLVQQAEKGWKITPVWLPFCRGAKADLVWHPMGELRSVLHSK